MTEEKRISIYTSMLLMGLHILIFGLLYPALAGVIMGGFFSITGIIGLTWDFYDMQKNSTILDWSKQIIPETVIVVTGFALFLFISFTTNEILLSIYFCNSILISGILFLSLGIHDKKRQPEIADKRRIRSSEQYEKHVKEIHVDFRRIKELPNIIKSREIEMEKSSLKVNKNILREIKSLNKELSSLKKKYKLRLFVDSELKELKS